MNGPPLQASTTLVYHTAQNTHQGPNLEEINLLQDDAIIEVEGVKTGQRDLLSKCGIISDRVLTHRDASGD
jgi:hypothetical protein